MTGNDTMATAKKVIIVGGGHNGLVTAGYLAREGLDVTVLESRSVVGGAAVTEELIPGYRMSTASFVVGLLRPEVISDLNLPEHGLELYASDEAISCTIGEDGSSFFMWRDLDRTLSGIKKTFGQQDLEGFMSFGMDMQEISRLMNPTIMAPPPELSTFVRYFEQSGNMTLFERFISGSVRDLVEHYFQADLLQSHFVFPGLVSMYGGPSSPGTAYLLAYHSVGEFMGQFGLWGYAKGGMGAITQSLARSAASHGADIRTNTAVRKIVTSNGKTTGVELADGSTIDAHIVVSNADPVRTLFDLVGQKHLPADLIQSMETYDSRGSMARVYVVVDELPAFIGFNASEKGAEHEGHIFLGPSVELFENGWDAQRRGRIPDDFALEVLIDTVRDDSFAPSGKHVLILGVQQLPFELAGSNWDEKKGEFTRRVVNKLLQFAPNLRDHILATRCHTPLDWARSYHLTGGNIYHGAMSLSRIFAGRPTHLRNGYATPIDGLYLCGSGTHPGGGVMGASGFNAAMAVLTDLDIATPRPWQIDEACSAGRAVNGRKSWASAAFENATLRKIMSGVATSPLSRPLNRLLTRSRRSGT